MNMPGFTAEASLYRNHTRYTSTNLVGESSYNNTVVTLQSCSGFKVLVCNPLIYACVLCFAIPNLPGALACFAGCLGGWFGYCRDCLDPIDVPDGGGGGGGGGGPCGCPRGTRCCGGCTKVPGQGLVCDDACVGPDEQCP